MGTLTFRTSHRESVGYLHTSLKLMLIWLLNATCMLTHYHLESVIWYMKGEREMCLHLGNCKEIHWMVILSFGEFEKWCGCFRYTLLNFPRFSEMGRGKQKKNYIIGNWSLELCVKKNKRLISFKENPADFWKVWNW